MSFINIESTFERRKSTFWLSKNREISTKGGKTVWISQYVQSRNWKIDPRKWLDWL